MDVRDWRLSGHRQCPARRWPSAKMGKLHRCRKTGPKSRSQSLAETPSGARDQPPRTQPPNSDGATYLSRVRRGHKRLPTRLPSQIAASRNSQRTTFSEKREALVIDAIRDDPALRERIYERYVRGRHRPTRGSGWRELSAGGRPSGLPVGQMVSHKPVGEDSESRMPICRTPQPSDAMEHRDCAERRTSDRSQGGGSTQPWTSSSPTAKTRSTRASTSSARRRRLIASANATTATRTR